MVLNGCTQEQIDDFNGGAQVHFGRVAGSGTADSLTYSFAVMDEAVSFDTVRIPIVVTGQKVPYDREVNVVVVAEKSTAVEGKDYVMGKTVIPAGMFEGSLKIRIDRREEQKEEERVVFLQILPTAELSTDVDTNWIDYKVKINDILTKPARWVYECQPYFGVYSKVKYLFIIETLGIWDFPDSGGNAIPKGQMSFYKDKMKTELARWEKENGRTMLDENGTAVKF